MNVQNNFGLSDEKTYEYPDMILWTAPDNLS